MKLLLSTFACTPLWGSEPGVGWRWALELAKKHDVTVVTHDYFEQHIADFVQRNPDVTLPRFIYVARSAFGIHPHRLLNSRIYYVLWQWQAYRHIKARGEAFDLVHHLTWGTYRFPSFMGLLGKPFVKGPIGGGERSPVRLFPRVPLKAFLFEAVRTLLIQLSRLDPLVWLSNCTADLVLCKTDETKSILPPPARKRAIVAAEIGAAPVPDDAQAKTYTPGKPVKLFFAGRLISCKGVNFAIKALRLLRERGMSVSLTVAGDGEMRASLENLARQEGVYEHVHFLGSLPRAELLKLYPEMDFFVFPSLHDSSGNVILESMSVGLPVVCLDLGGPRYFVNDSCGRVVATTGASETQVVTGLAHALGELIQNPVLANELSQGAIARSRELSWENQIGKVYSIIEEKLFSEKHR